MTVDIPPEFAGGLILSAAALVIGLIERAAKRLHHSPAVQRANARDAAADDGEQAVRDALVRSDVAWQKRWDAREAEIAVLVRGFNALAETNQRNADLHRESLDHLGEQLQLHQNRIGQQREEISELRSQISAKEGEIRHLQDSFDSLQNQYEAEKRVWHRTMDQERLLREDMTRRAAAHGVPFTATDVLGQPKR